MTALTPRQTEIAVQALEAAMKTIVEYASTIQRDLADTSPTAEGEWAFLNENTPENIAARHQALESEKRHYVEAHLTWCALQGLRQDDDARKIAARQFMGHVSGE